MIKKGLAALKIGGDSQAETEIQEKRKLNMANLRDALLGANDGNMDITFKKKKRAKKQEVAEVGEDEV